MEASFESLQNVDMMDVSVLGEADVENSAPDFGDDGTDSILDSLCDSKDYVAAQLRELPAQLAEPAVGNSETVRGASSPRLLGLVCCLCGHEHAGGGGKSKRRRTHYHKHLIWYLNLGDKLCAWELP